MEGAIAMVLAVAKIYTAEEYLALEVESETRHEFRNGEILPMAGGTPAHNEIAGDLTGLLKAALKGQPYSVFVADQRLAIPLGAAALPGDPHLYTYPDVMVVPRPLALHPGRKDTVTSPILIAEVLSDSTEAYDRDQKFAAYRSIPTFREYLLIDQDRLHVEHYIKQRPNQWLFSEYDGQDGRFALASIPVEIALADLYENVAF
jgi:Uma2 family endonuclease